MTIAAGINKTLLVLGPDLIGADEQMESPLIQRAVELAKVSGCEIELFHVCYQGDLYHQLFESSASLKQQQEYLVDRDAKILGEVASRLENESINVSHEIIWNSPRTDAILAKISRSNPDLVMKQSRDHSYMLGITSNTEWDLARRSTADLWMVGNNTAPIERIIAAVGNKMGDPVDISTAEDFDVLENAAKIAGIYDAQIFPLNAYQLPSVQTYAGEMMGIAAPTVVNAADQAKQRLSLVKKHGDSVRALAQYFNIEGDNVLIREGHPNDVLPEMVETMDANMIVMGARSIGRLERLLSSVTVEPVLADTKCDILIVRDPQNNNVVEAAYSPTYPKPNNSDAFKASVAAQPTIS